MKKSTFSTLAVMSAFVLSSQALTPTSVSWFSEDFTDATPGSIISGTSGWTEANPTAVIGSNESGNYVDLNYTAGLTYTPAEKTVQNEVNTELKMSVYMVGSMTEPDTNTGIQTQIYLDISGEKPVLKAYQATGEGSWVSLTTPSDVTNESWVNLRIVIDYRVSKARIYANDTEAGTIDIPTNATMKKLNSVTFAGAGKLDNFVGTRNYYALEVGGSTSDGSDGSEVSPDATVGTPSVTVKDNVETLTVEFPATKTTVEGEVSKNDEIQFIFFTNENGERCCKRVTVDENTGTDVVFERAVSGVGSGTITAYYGETVSAINVYGANNIEKTPTQTTFGTSEVSFEIPVKSGLYYTVVVTDASGNETMTTMDEAVKVEAHGTKHSFKVSPSKDKGVVRFKVVVSDDKPSASAK